MVNNNSELEKAFQEREGGHYKVAVNLMYRLASPPSAPKYAMPKLNDVKAFIWMVFCHLMSMTSQPSWSAAPNTPSKAMVGAMARNLHSLMMERWSLTRMKETGMSHW